MKQNVYIFIGHSGAGKGTQVALLQKRLEAQDSRIRTYHLETGSMFRDLAKGNNFTAKKTREMMDSGKLPPAFLGVHAWAHRLIEDYDGEQHVFIDGTPRLVVEIPALLSAFDFYEWEPHVFFLQVSDEWAYDHLLQRGRPDDTDAQRVWGRIEWFHQNVVPAISVLKDSGKVIFHTIHGEQSIESVHKDICAELGLL